MDARYSRLERFAPLGGILPRWQTASVAVVGCGGLGGGLVQHLARLGVAALTLIDRDTVGPENLGHQVLFTEADAGSAIPKAIAAATAVQAINSAVRVTAHVASLDRHNIRGLLTGAELIFDGLDSYATRYVLNDYALATGTPYLYAGVVRGELASHAIVPGVTSCLRCLLDHAPAAGETPTCAAEGVYPPLLGLANLLQLRAAEVLLTSRPQAVEDVLWAFDLAQMQLRRVPLAGPASDCPACAGQYDYLDGLAGIGSTAACAPDRFELDLGHPLPALDSVAARLAASQVFELRRNAWCLTAETDGRRYTIFASGRLALSGGERAQELEQFAATYLGV